MVGIELVDASFLGNWAFTTVSVKSLLLFSSPVREEVVTNSGGVLGVGVPLLNELVNVGEVLEAHVELFKGSVGLVLLGEVLHELESDIIKGRDGTGEGESDEGLHVLDINYKLINSESHI